MSNAPDRIMVSVDFERLGRIKVKTSCVTVGLVGVPEPFEPARYLLSTPSREHADELVEALGRMLSDAVTEGCDWCCMNDARALLAKINEASNE